MRRSTKISAALFSVGVIVSVVAFFMFYLGSAHTQNAQAQQSNALLQMMPQDVVVGDPNAPVTIIEYSSMSCPHCATFHKTIYPQLKAKYIDTGTAKFTNRHFPLNEPALRAGMLTLCVDKTQTPRFTAVLFEMQEKWAFTPDFLDNLKRIATVGGVTPEQFDACMANKQLEESLLLSRKQATEMLGVNSTPMLFVNGQQLSGHMTMQMFDQAIAKAMGQ